MRGRGTCIGPGSHVVVDGLAVGILGVVAERGNLGSEAVDHV